MDEAGWVRLIVCGKYKTLSNRWILQWQANSWRYVLNEWTLKTGREKALLFHLMHAVLSQIHLTLPAEILNQARSYRIEDGSNTGTVLVCKQEFEVFA